MQIKRVIKKIIDWNTIRSSQAWNVLDANLTIRNNLEQN